MYVLHVIVIGLFWTSAAAPMLSRLKPIIQPSKHAFFVRFASNLTAKKYRQLIDNVELACKTNDADQFKKYLDNCLQHAVRLSYQNTLYKITEYSAMSISGIALKGLGIASSTWTLPIYALDGLQMAAIPWLVGAGLFVTGEYVRDTNAQIARGLILTVLNDYKKQHTEKLFRDLADQKGSMELARRDDKADYDE